MANKDLFKQAIAEAKSVREAAIANAKEALEETLTPHLKDMLAAKLQEMEDSQNEEVVNESEEVEETAEETVNEEVNEEETVEEATEEVDEAHGACPKCGKTHEGSCGTHEEVSEEGLTEIEPVEAADEDEAEDDSEESEDEAEHDEMPDGDEDISNLSVDQFKDMIRDIIAQEVGGDAAADDMDAGDIEGMGDEDDMEADMEEPEMAGDEEEIDLDELLAELEATEEVTEGEDKDDKKMEEEAVEEVSTAKSTEVQDTANAEAQGTNVNRVVKEDATEDKTELEQALETIETLKSDLNEVNILNSKLLYVNKIFKSNNLSESQKVNIIAAFDKAETVKEVKLVFETVSDNIIDVKKENVSEAKIKGMASKATGTTASKPQGEIVLSEAAQRMQKLAGIIK
jgi:hypothetical protein